MGGTKSSLGCFPGKDRHAVGEQEADGTPTFKRNIKPKDFFLESIKIMEHRQEKERRQSSTTGYLGRSRKPRSTRNFDLNSERGFSVDQPAEKDALADSSSETVSPVSVSLFSNTITTFNLLNRPDSRSSEKADGSGKFELGYRQSSSSLPSTRDWLDAAGKTKSLVRLNRRYGQSYSVDETQRSVNHAICRRCRSCTQPRSDCVSQRKYRSKERQKKQDKEREWEKQEELDWKTDPFTAKYRHSAFARALREKAG
ncbi:hypothetical protein CAPTEDRAFT_200291 [Capitella teleta]|uniref:Uncharacterized protein n=1 Tax=Capitella teleta TaxID=283909 RepID=R7V4Z2_CAPTE|nr:hypothetical protein CAPTEDRAFT_200291 [Capitella teleta]|eukprot:ELU10845.1 hypothetical protein CAPTEDRAFT_200291 [Capitella teleta]